MKLCNVIFVVSLAFLVDGYSCRCEKCIKNIPENIQVLPLEKCTEYTRYESELGPAKEDGKLFEKILKKRVARFNNVAGTIIIFPDGVKKEVYRSAFLSESPKSLEELVKKRKIKTIINVYNTDKFDITPWFEKEKRLFDSYGGSTYIHIRDFKYRYTSLE